MKKIFTIAAIAVFGALSMVACKKSSTSSSCTCTIPGGSTTGKDTSYTFPTNGGVSCAQENTAVKSVFPTGGCK